MTLLTQLVLAAAINGALLAVASWEFHRHGIGANLVSAYPLAGLCVWTIAEVAIENGSAHAPLAYALVMGAIGVGVATDQATGYILDVVTLPSCVLAIVAEALGGAGLRSAIGATTVSGAMLLLYTITRGQGLGLGDVKLAAAMGTLLGAKAGLISIGVSFVLGGCIAAVLIVTRRGSRKMTLPFAPYLAAGVLAALTLAET